MENGVGSGGNGVGDRFLRASALCQKTVPEPVLPRAIGVLISNGKTGTLSQKKLALRDIAIASQTPRGHEE
jgi:hypothetical protein